MGCKLDGERVVRSNPSGALDNLPGCQDNPGEACGTLVANLLCLSVAYWPMSRKKTVPLLSLIGTVMPLLLPPG